MTPITRLAALVLVASFVAPMAAVDGKKAEYIGGTIAGMPEKTEGRLREPRSRIAARPMCRGRSASRHRRSVDRRPR